MASSNKTKDTANSKETAVSNEKSLVVILDPAHGEDVKGKCSPDGKHKEWEWSRKVSTMIEKALLDKGYKVHWTNKTNKEIGLSKRKEVADKIPGKHKLLISSHNNAAGDGTKWIKATGIEIFTTPGKTKSDLYADLLFEQGFKPNIGPLVKVRKDVSDGDMDKEANFTVLMGKSYAAILIEWFFQDSPMDINKLVDNVFWDNVYVNSVVSGIEAIENYINSKK